VSIPNGVNLDSALAFHLPLDELKGDSTRIAAGKTANVVIGSGKIVDDPERGKVFQPGQDGYDLHITNLPRSRYDRTISFWFKPLRAEGGNYTPLRVKHRRWGAYYEVNYNGRWLNLVHDSIRLSDKVIPQQWNHLALVYDGNRNVCYLNGQNVRELSNHNFPENDLFGFKGDQDILYDDLRIYDRPLTAEEAAAIAGK
jgi:hypothetical protein